MTAHPGFDIEGRIALSHWVEPRRWLCIGHRRCRSRACIRCGFIATGGVRRETHRERDRHQPRQRFYVGREFARAMIGGGPGRSSTSVRCKANWAGQASRRTPRAKVASKSHPPNVRGLGPSRFADQRARARLLRHEADGGTRERRRIQCLARHAYPRRPMGAHRGTRRRCCSSRPRRRASSMARSSTWTAA